jgi:hypothetical protein
MIDGAMKAVTLHVQTVLWEAIISTSEWEVVIISDKVLVAEEMTAVEMMDSGTQQEVQEALDRHKTSTSPSDLEQDRLKSKHPTEASPRELTTKK